jgi:anti-anti-sigma factor
VTLDSIGAGVAVLTLLGEFHHREARDLERALSEALGGSFRHLVVDMRGVALFDALNLRVLVKGALRSRDAGMGFGLVRPQPDVWHSFELTGLDSQLPNSGLLEEAVAALTRGD